jgi:hypothetical protein
MVITALQKRILNALLRDDLIWEVAGADYFTQFNEKTGKQVRIRPAELESMHVLGWIERVWHDPASHKLDYWQLTPAGRAAAGSYVKVAAAAADSIRALSA